MGIRADDYSNDEVLKRFQGQLPLRRVEAKGVGVIGSMDSCLREASGDYIGLLDDDIELPPEWIHRMVEHIRGDSNVYASGGRDILQDHPEMRRTEPVTEDVGRFHWFGRITGDHHRGGGSRGRSIFFEVQTLCSGATFFERLDSKPTCEARVLKSIGNLHLLFRPGKEEPSFSMIPRLRSSIT